MPEQNEEVLAALAAEAVRQIRQAVSQKKPYEEQFDFIVETIAMANNLDASGNLALREKVELKYREESMALAHTKNSGKASGFIGGRIPRRSKINVDVDTKEAQLPVGDRAGRDVA